jgi:hypothetical protein
VVVVDRNAQKGPDGTGAPVPGRFASLRSEDRPEFARSIEASARFGEHEVAEGGPTTIDGEQDPVFEADRR